MYYVLIAILTIIGYFAVLFGFVWLIDRVLCKEAHIWNKYNFYR